MATTPWVAGLYTELVSYPAPQVWPLNVRALEAEERSALLPPLPPGAENYYADLFAYKNSDTRAWLQLLLDEDTRRTLLPPAPNSFEDWTWSAWFGAVPARHSSDAEWSTFTPPALPPPLNLGWDEFEWNKSFGETGWRAASGGEEPALLFFSVPFVPDDAGALSLWGAQGFSGLLVMDEFVNAPTGGVGFGPAPKGRSVRFGFSISAFR
ncbi:MAG TPA: hypothetical protein VKT53_00745 [Candidatus Acidoferrum sp.]|nr:hypothetical protein [Candidatus Acidoferrum sp.]